MVGPSKEKRKGSEDLDEGERKRGKLDLRRQLEKELEAVKKELEAVKKETEAVKKETEALKKETEALKKEWRSLGQGEEKAWGRG